MDRWSRAQTLVVFALEKEAQGCFGDVSVLFTGIGKVNAAYRLTQGLMTWTQKYGAPPALVLNLGSAGSPHFNTGELINCTHFIQRDFDVTPLGAPPYTTPFEDGPATLDNGVLLDGFSRGICGTGDSFVTSCTDCGWNVVDMEAYALAKICRSQNVPFACLKYITDGANGDAALDWPEKVKHAAVRLREAVDELWGR